jgi:hypothetical protein
MIGSRSGYNGKHHEASNFSGKLDQKRATTSLTPAPGLPQDFHLASCQTIGMDRTCMSAECTIVSHTR